MFVLLTLVLGCDTRCPTFDELEVRIGEDGDAPLARDRAERAISNFRSWTTLDGVCVDTVRIGIAQTEWEHPAWLNDGRDEILLSPSIPEDQVYGATMHGLCHAADEALGGVSEAHAELFEAPIPGLLLGRRETIQENFAKYCAMGPFADHGADLDESCEPTLGFNQKRVILETVFDAVDDPHSVSTLLPLALGEAAALSRPEGLKDFGGTIVPTDHGLLLVGVSDGRWVALTYRPHDGALLHELTLEAVGEDTVWWEGVTTTGERRVLVRTFIPFGSTDPEDQAMSAWELGEDGALTLLGASEHTASHATTGVVEPRGVWVGSEDSVLVDLQTNEELGAASSLLGVRGAVKGVVGADLRVVAEDGSTTVVGLDGAVRLTLPPLEGWAEVTDRVTARSGQLVLHAQSVDGGVLSLVGVGPQGDASVLASGCGERAPAVATAMAFEVDGAPMLLARHLSWTEMSVYPLVEIP